MAYQQPPGYEPPPLGGSAPPDFTLPPRFRPPRPPFDYSRLIKDTLSLVWRHKFLWFFGLFAGGITTFNWPGNFSGNFQFDQETAPSRPSQTSKEIGNWVSAHLGLVIAAAAALVVLAILVWLWSVVCRGAVIGSVKDIREQKPSGFMAAFARGRQSFGRLLLFDLFLVAIWAGLAVVITAVVVFLVFMAVSLGAAGKTIVIIVISLTVLGITGLAAASLGYLTFFSLWFVLGVAIGLLVIYATRAVVLDHAGPIEALRRAWRLMIDTLARTLLLFLLSTGLSIAGSIVASLAMVLTAIPAIAAWVITGLSGWPTPGIAISILLSLLPIAALVISFAILNTYLTAFWTIIYMKLTGLETETA